MCIHYVLPCNSITVSPTPLRVCVCFTSHAHTPLVPANTTHTYVYCVQCQVLTKQ